MSDDADLPGWGLLILYALIGVIAGAVCTGVFVSAVSKKGGQMEVCMDWCSNTANSVPMIYRGKCRCPLDLKP